MTKDELQAKRVVALKELKDAEEVLCLDEHYIDIVERKNAELQNKVDILQGYLDHDIEYDMDKKLTQAKDLLKRMFYLYHDPCVTNKDLQNRDKLFEEITQFLNDDPFKHYHSEAEQELNLENNLQDFM